MEEKDKLQRYLESVCHVQKWAKNHINKEKKEVGSINKLSISSIKQRINKTKQD